MYTGMIMMVCHDRSPYSVAAWVFLCGTLTIALRLIALVGKNLEERHYIYPGLLSLLIPLKFKNPTLYRRFILGECRASAVMDYIDQVVSIPTGDPQLDFPLTVVEASYIFRAKSNDLKIPGNHQFCSNCGSSSMAKS